MTAPNFNTDKKRSKEETELEYRKRKLNQEKLYLMQMNQKRRYIVVGTSLAFAFIWTSFAVLQSEILNLKAEETSYYGNVLETVALVFCITSLACSIALIYIYNKQNKKEKELQALSKENKEEVQDNKQKKKEKELQDNRLEKNAVYLDAFASLVIVITEVIVILNIWGAISDVNKSLGLKNAAMNFQGISDTISNIICVGVALMFLYIAIDKYKSNKKASTNKEFLLKEEGEDREISDKNALIGAGLITVGGLFMLIRKVLSSLEVTNSISYTGNIGKGFKMDTLPLGLIFGVVGIAVFLVGFGFSINLANQDIKEQSECIISGVQVDRPEANKAEATVQM